LACLVDRSVVPSATQLPALLDWLEQKEKNETEENCTKPSEWK
jgi:hypothetical protein